MRSLDPLLAMAPCPLLYDGFSFGSPLWVSSLSLRALRESVTFGRRQMLQRAVNCLR